MDKDYKKASISILEKLAKDFANDNNIGLIEAQYYITKSLTYNTVIEEINNKAQYLLNEVK